MGKKPVWSKTTRSRKKCYNLCSKKALKDQKEIHEQKKYNKLFKHLEKNQEII